MTPIESFVVALLFIGGCGFLCGIPSGHESLKRSRDVELPKVSWGDLVFDAIRGAIAPG